MVWPYSSRTELITSNSLYSCADTHEWFISSELCESSKTGTLTKQPETQTRMPTPALQSGLPPLWVRSFLDICHDFCDCVLCGFYGWIHPAEVRHSREKRRLGYESYMFSVRKQKFFIPFLPVGLLLPSMLFMKPFISIKEFWGWSFIPLFV